MKYVRFLTILIWIDISSQASPWILGVSEASLETVCVSSSSKMYTFLLMFSEMVIYKWQMAQYKDI